MYNFHQKLKFFSKDQTDFYTQISKKLSLLAFFIKFIKFQTYFQFIFLHFINFMY